MTYRPDDDTVAEAAETPTGATAASAPDGSFGDVAGMAPVEGELVEEPIGVAPDELGEVDDPTADLEAQLAERTSDLQRLQAEFVNYKRRVDRDRDVVRQNATYAVLAPITEVLDTIDLARGHAELDGGFKTVAEQLERTVEKLGLAKFGEVGDPFDPLLHEALSHIGEDPEVEVTTCKVVAKAGYRIGDRVVRAAQVLVVEPAVERVSTSSTSGPEVEPVETPPTT